MNCHILLILSLTFSKYEWFEGWHIDTQINIDNINIIEKVIHKMQKGIAIYNLKQYKIILIISNKEFLKY